MASPTTRFAFIGDDRVAFHVSVHGPVTVVIVYGTCSHIEVNWEIPAVERVLDRLGQFVTVVDFSSPSSASTAGAAFQARGDCSRSTSACRS